MYSFDRQSSIFNKILFNKVVSLFPSGIVYLVILVDRRHFVIHYCSG